MADSVYALQPTKTVCMQKGFMCIICLFQCLIGKTAQLWKLLNHHVTARWHDQ